MQGHLNKLLLKDLIIFPKDPHHFLELLDGKTSIIGLLEILDTEKPVSYTHLRAHETREDLVCRLLLEKKN